MTDRVTLKIPRPLYNTLKRVIEGTGYRSVNEFVVHVLRDLAADLPSQPRAMTSDEVDRIRQRLQNLGYLE